MGSSSGGEIDFETPPMTPQMEAVWRLLRPSLRLMRDQVRKGEPMYDIPQMPAAPEPYLPDISGMMPGRGWYEGLSPDIRAGIEQPWMQRQSNLLEQLGSRGMVGSPRGGYSGAAGRALGEYWTQQAMPAIQNQAWGMVSPALRQGYLSDLELTNLQGSRDYQAALMGQQQELGRTLAPWQMLPNLAGYAFPTPVGMQQQGGSPWGGVGNALGGALSGGALLSGTPVGAPIGAALGGLSGFLGGK